MGGKNGGKMNGYPTISPSAGVALPFDFSPTTASGKMNGGGGKMHGGKMTVVTPSSDDTVSPLGDATISNSGFAGKGGKMTRGLMAY